STWAWKAWAALDVVTVVVLDDDVGALLWWLVLAPTRAIAATAPISGTTTAATTLSPWLEDGRARGAPVRRFRRGTLPTPLRKRTGRLLFRLRLVGPVRPHRGEEILMELHPHGVVGVAAWRGQPGPVVADPLEGLGQPGPVTGEAADDLPEPLHQPAGPLVEAVEPFEDLEVVGGVGVVVGLVARLQLPVGADAQELDVEDQEPLVGRPGQFLLLRSGGEAGPGGVGVATGGGQGEVGTPGDGQPGTNELVFGRRPLRRAESPQPEVVEEAPGVIAERGGVGGCLGDVGGHGRGSYRAGSGADRAFTQGISG